MRGGGGQGESDDDEELLTMGNGQENFIITYGC